MAEILQQIPTEAIAPQSGVSLRGAEAETLPHPAVVKLSRLLDNSQFIGIYTQAKTEDEITEKWLSLFRMQRDLEERQHDPELIDALELWGRCKDTRGLAGEKGAMVNSGVVHYFGYEASPKKAGRFGDVSIQGFIDLSIHLRDAITQPLAADYYARILDGKGRAKWYVLQDNRLIVGFQHENESSPKVITAIPMGENGKDVFFRKVSREIFSEKAVRRSNRLNGAPPLFEIGGQMFDAKTDLLMPMPNSQISKRGEVFHRQV